MNHEEFKRRFPMASESVLRANTDQPPDEASKLERDSGNELGGEVPDQKEDPSRYVVRVITYTTRLYDEDDICEKFHIDALRYCGVIPGDLPKKCKITVAQVKVLRPEDEKTVLEIHPPSEMNPDEKRAVIDYSERLARWLDLKLSRGDTVAGQEPTNTHIKDMWLADQIRKKIFKERGAQ